MWTVGSVPNRNWGDEPIYEGVATLLGAIEGPDRTTWDPRFTPPPRKVRENTGRVPRRKKASARGPVTALVRSVIVTGRRTAFPVTLVYS